MSTKDFKTLQFEINEGVGTLSLNRPDKLNALNSEVLTELKEILTDLHKKAASYEIKGLIFTGSGEKAFIAGADIAEMSDMTTAEAYKFGALGQEVTFLFENLTIPVIACVNGFALGGGCEMALSCDFIYATENAVFGQPEVKLGLIPGFGGTQRLAKVIGRAWAKEVIYTGRNIKAAEALQLGLALKLFSTKEELIEGAKKTLSFMTGNSPLAVSIAKEVINAGVDAHNEVGLKAELDKFSQIFSSEDMKEGTKAFVEKRKAAFIGR